MKSKTKININFLTVTLLLNVSMPVFGIANDLDKSIKINSENQCLDIQKNIAIFTGKVLITQGSIKITADKVVVTRSGNDSRKTIVDAYGNPVTFYQLQNNGKPVQGHAKKMHYELANDRVELIGTAYLEQLDSNVTGALITYLVKEQKMQAYSSSRERVTTVLVPSQLREKNTQSTG